MHRHFLVFACIFMLLAGCGNPPQPDSMTAAIYDAAMFEQSPPGHPMFTHPVKEWEITSTKEVQQIYHLLFTLPSAQGGGINICSGYGELLTFRADSTVIAQAYSDPCIRVGIHVSMIQGNRRPTEQFLQLIQQAIGFGFEPYTSAPLPPN
jgi:hypothetical protein